MYGVGWGEKVIGERGGKFEIREDNENECDCDCDCLEWDS